MGWCLSYQVTALRRQEEAELREFLQQSESTVNASNRLSSVNKKTLI
jgi:hypothetical protein